MRPGSKRGGARRLVGLALLVVLETLTPAERVAFVLHDMFDLSFDEIAPIVGRTPTRRASSRAAPAAASRAATQAPAADRDRRREIVDAFLAASRGGDFGALLAVLDPDVVFRGDREAVRLGGPPELNGAEAVAGIFQGRAQGARPALVDGAPGLAVMFGGRLRIVLALTIEGDRIAAIEAIADPERLRGLEITMLDG